MALSSSEYADENGNWVYEVDGQQVDASTYATQTTAYQQTYAERKAEGWSDINAEQYAAEQHDPDYSEFNYATQENLVIDPVTRGALTESEYETQVADRQAASNLEIAKEAAQAVADEQNDWRVRLHLAPESDYLYQATNPGILQPLKDTNGIIFPYTPQIAVQYTADYENYDLVHSNYRGYFYKGSKVENIILTATFTANDVYEANYMLAALHFLKSATKMFYGQDKQRGMPPPIVFLTGLGEYQFNNHPCAITMMNYNLPNDVDYIPCGKAEGVAPLPVNASSPTSTAEARLAASGIKEGGTPPRPGALNNATINGENTTYKKATYVPTKIDINFTMIPIQTRDQVSKEFSLEEYANGSLLKKGFW